MFKPDPPKQIIAFSTFTLFSSSVPLANRQASLMPQHLVKRGETVKTCVAEGFVHQYQHLMENVHCGILRVHST